VIFSSEISKFLTIPLKHPSLLAPSEKRNSFVEENFFRIELTLKSYPLIINDVLLSSKVIAI